MKGSAFEVSFFTFQKQRVIIRLVISTAEDKKLNFKIIKYVIIKTSNFSETTNGSDTAIAAKNRNVADDIDRTFRSDSGGNDFKSGFGRSSIR